MRQTPNVLAWSLSAVLLLRGSAPAAGKDLAVRPVAPFSPAVGGMPKAAELEIPPSLEAPRLLPDALPEVPERTAAPRETQASAVALQPGALENTVPEKPGRPEFRALAKRLANGAKSLFSARAQVTQEPASDAVQLANSDKILDALDAVLERSDPESAAFAQQLRVMLKFYSKDDSGVNAAFIPLPDGRYQEIHSGAVFTRENMAQWASLGNALRVLPPPKAASYLGIDPLNKTRFLVMINEKEYSLPIVRPGRIQGAFAPRGGWAFNADGSLGGFAPQASPLAATDAQDEKKEQVAEIVSANPNVEFYRAFQAAEARALAALREAYRELNRSPGPKRQIPADEVEMIRLQAIHDTILERMPYSRGVLDLELPGLINASELLGTGGVCRHQNLVAAQMIDRMIKLGKLSGEARYVTGDTERNGGHAWAAFKSKKTGKLYILDVAAKTVGEIADLYRSELYYTAHNDPKQWPMEEYDIYTHSTSPSERQALAY